MVRLRFVAGELRKSSVAIGIIGMLILLAVVTLVHSHIMRELDKPVLVVKEKMVRELGLTDLCLFTEARYTRHLSQADLHTPFQDHPLSLEHFPSGSLLTPPELLKRHHE